MENFPIFPIRKVPGNVLKTLLWGPKTIRKKYWVVFEIFLKSMFFSAFSENIVRRFLSGKISDFSNSETSKSCLQKSSVGTRNNQKKILSTFWDIPKNHVFSAFQNGTSVLPSVNTSVVSLRGPRRWAVNTTSHVKSNKSQIKTRKNRTCRTRHFKDFGTELARLGTFRGFGTERARLGTFNHFAN